MVKRLTPKASLTARTKKTLAGLATFGKLDTSALPQPISFSQLKCIQSKRQVNAFVAVGARIENSRIFLLN